MMTGGEQRIADDVALRGELRRDEPMSRHTSWRAGGVAERFYRPADCDDLALFLSRLDAGEPVFWLGLGSNLLVRDGGIRGVVISTAGLLNGLEQREDGLVRVEAGVACARVARFCARAGLSGAEFLVGIPGTMGGALAMNAGAFGAETWGLVAALETMNRHGERYRRVPADYQIAYREVHGPQGEWFIAAHLALPAGECEAGQARIKALLDKRNHSQPIGRPSSGSVFRNPQGDHAGRLIEACGLKGYCIGDACVSDKHANFFINQGAATASDIEALIDHVAGVVESRFKISLQPEVHIVGEPLAPQGESDD